MEGLTFIALAFVVGWVLFKRPEWATSIVEWFKRLFVSK